MAATDITLEVNVQTTTSEALGGLALGLDGNNYVAVVVSNNKVLLHNGSAGHSGPWFSIGELPNSGAFIKQWVGLSLFIRQHDSYTVALKGSVNGHPFPANCGSDCIGVNLTSHVQLYTPGAGDVGLFGLVDVSDFSGLRFNVSTKTYVTVNRCIPDAELRRHLSNAMSIDEAHIKQLDNPCTKRQKRDVEQAPVVVSFVTTGVSQLAPSAVGPSIMAASLEVGGALASTAAAASVSSVAPVAAAAVSASVAAIAVIAETAVVASAASAAVLSVGAIAGVVAAGAVGVAVAAAASAAAIKKLQSDEPGKEYDQFQDRPSEIPMNPLMSSPAPIPEPEPAPAPAPAPAPVQSVPKGGKAILLTHLDDMMTSFTGRGVPIPKNPPGQTTLKK